MTVRDVILTAYAWSAQANCAAWASSYFLDEPLVLAVPGSEGSFVRKGRQWAASGDAFRAAIQELSPQHKDITIGRRALVCVSGGWQLVHHILLNQQERILLDACIIQDGPHTKEVDPWVHFAERAAKGEAWFMMAHNIQTIVPYSAKDTAERIFRLAAEAHPNGPRYALPDYLARPVIPKDGIKAHVVPVRDATGRLILPAQTKIWTKDSLDYWENLGDMYRLQYKGQDRPDLAYLAYHVAPRLWRLLGEHWMGAVRKPLPQT